MATERYIIRVVMDTEDDVIRDVLIDPRQSLRELHELILKGFELAEGEMASFFLSDQEWNQGEEISLIDFDAPLPDARFMQDVTIADVLSETGDRLIYVYDMLNLWTFFLEVLSTDEKSSEDKIVAITGTRPDEAPLKNMESIGDDMDMFNDTSMESLDDMDDWEEDFY